MHDAAPSPFRVPYDGSFRLSDARTTPPKGAPDASAARARLAKMVERLSELQEALHADDRYAVLLIFQAMDAAGKDGTIRAVLTGINPAGCQVFSFKAPSGEELEHDFLWRPALRLPERGRIGVFNRSYYEEVLVVRAHPEFLGPQKLPDPEPRRRLWKQRFESIREFERHLARNGIVILKFWLHVSKAEQRRRFLARLETPEKNWKFNAHDIEERAHWKAHMRAYEETLAETSRPWAPWYAIPADDKPFMRKTVAEIIVASLKDLGLRYPSCPKSERAALRRLHAQLRKES